MHPMCIGEFALIYNLSYNDIIFLLNYLLLALIAVMVKDSTVQLVWFHEHYGGKKDNASTLNLIIGFIFGCCKH